MSRDVVNATRIKPGTDTPNKLDLKVYLTEDVSAYDILYVSGVQGAFLKVSKAINTTAVQSTGLLLMARSAGQANHFIRATSFGTIRDVDTSGDTVGDAYYLGATAGAVAKTTVGFARRVGYVIKVGTVVNGGRIMFVGTSQVNGGSNILAGTATILSGNPSITIVQATLGGAALGGKPVVAQLNATDGTLYVKSAAWSTNDLVITISGNATADRIVSYMIAVS